MFLEYIFRNLAQLDNLESCTPSKVIDTIEKVQIVTPAESSWGGANGYHDVWLNSSNSWIYRYIYDMTEKMILYANTYQNPSSLEKRLLNQMAREVFFNSSE